MKTELELGCFGGWLVGCQLRVPEPGEEWGLGGNCAAPHSLHHTTLSASATAAIARRACVGIYIILFSY